MSTPESPRARGPIDLPKVEAAAGEMLRALGYDLTDESLRDTPARVARMYEEILTAKPFESTTFPNDGAYDELVVVRDIPFHALCEHHLLPFTGVAHVGYIPGPRIVGLSKLARVVEMYSRELQVQERMTAQVANWLEETLQPRGVGVVLEAEHLCMTVRGVRAPGSRTTTSSVRGLVRHDPRTRAEFFALVGASTGA
ncbi:MAG: GTP cyclohydrolase I FolE [Gaiellales bacterium]